MVKRTLVLSLLLTLTLAAFAQDRGNLSGTGDAGGIANFQSQGNGPKLQITTENLPSATIGVPYSVTLGSRFGVGALAWTETGTLPAGITLTTGGLLSGTPLNNAANFNIVVTVTDSSSPTPQAASQPLTLSVLCTPLQLASPITLPVADQGTAFSYTVITTGGIAPVLFSATGLPTGLSISSTTGAITGTPTVAGTYTNIVITATDSCPLTPQSVHNTFTMQVNATLAITTPPTLQPATLGVAYGSQITASGGTTPYVFSVSAGALPTGLTLNSSTGAITGTPTQFGNITFTITVTDAAAATVSVPFSINVACGVLTNTTTALPNGTQGSQYSAQATAQGGFGILNWSGENIPGGLAISATGLLAGVPINAGAFTPTLRVTDSCPVPQVRANQVPLTIAPAIGPLLIATQSPLPNAVAGTPLSDQFQASGGVTPYQWSTTANSVPPGTVLNSNGLLAGTPTTSGTFTPTVQVQDTTLATTSKPFSITVTCPSVSITSGATLPGATQGTAYAGFQFNAVGGVLPYVWTISAGALPPGMTLSGSGFLSGTPGSFGTFSATARVRDACLPTGSTATLPFTIVVSNNVGALTITTASPAAAGVQGQGLSAPFAATGGVPPYQWTVPSGTVPPGAIDMIDWVQMTLPDRNSFCMTGGATPKCSVLGAGLLWWVKSFSGWAADLELYDDKFIYEYATENNDANQQAACKAAGYSSCFLDPFAYKQAVNLTPAFPRYFVPGSTVTLMTPTTLQGGSKVNPFIRTTNCGADNQSLVYLGNKKFVTTGFLTGINFGGIIGVMPYIENDYYYSGNASGVYVNLEKRFFVKPYGWVRFELWQLVNGVYVLQSGSTNNAKTAHAAVTPNFGCKVPNLPLTGTLPPGNTATSSANLDMKSSTGVESGTPNKSGTYNYTVQVEDSVGTIAQKAFTQTISCTALAWLSTSPLPKATQNLAYNFTFSTSEGTAPVTYTATGVPAGMALSPAGVLSGTPTATGTFSIVVTATDACNPTHNAVPRTFSLTVAPPIAQLAITTGTPFPPAIIGQVINLQMQANGGVTPYNWALQSGTLSAGTSISTSGLITGTITTTSTYTPTISVTDAQPVTVSKAFTWQVSCPAFSVTTTALPPAQQGTAYSFQMAFSGGFGAVTWGASGLPSGLSVSSGGLISGIPSVNGTFTPTLTATDSCNPTPTAVPKQFTLQVNTVTVAITTPPTLPQGQINQSYNTSFNATGGTGPYTWLITVGAPQTGLSLSSAGVLSGVPTVASTVSFTVQVTDSAAHVGTGVFSLTINPAQTSGADNRYCNANETTNFTTPTDGPATLITNCDRTAMADTPSPGSIVNVAATASCATLQAAITGAACGSTVVLPNLNNNAQTVISSCSLNIVNKCTAAQWLTIESGGITSSSFPPEGTRATPAHIGVPSLHIACPAGSVGGSECGRPAYNQPTVAGIYMPKIVASGATQTVTFTGASHVRMIGFELTTPSGVNSAQVVRCASGDHLIIDRSLIHGGNSATFQDKDNVQAGVRWEQCQYGSVIDSTILDTHCLNNGTCTDAQAIFMSGSTSGPVGPFKAVNNFMETSGETILTGGGGVGTSTTAPTDLEIRRNHFWKPVFWKANDPAYFGTSFQVKNLLEFKNVNRTLIEGNVMENTWSGQSDQHGVGVLFDSRNQNLSYSGVASASGNTLTWVSGPQFQSNIVSPTCAPGGCRVTFGGVACVAVSFISPTQITVSCGSGGGGGITNNWVQVPTPTGATHIRYFDINPSNNHFYIADRVSGFWLSTNQGGSWTQINTGITPLTGWAINWDSAHSQLIAGIQNGANSTAFYRSANEGASWTKMTVPNAPTATGSAPAYTGFALMPNGTLIDGGFFGPSGTCGSWTSTNAGVTNVASSCPANSPVAAPGGAFSYLYNPIDNVLWLGTENAGLYCSTNNGTSFTPATVPFTGSAPRVGNIDGLSYDANGVISFAAQGGIWKLNGTGCSSHTLTNTFVNTTSANGRTVGRDSTSALYWGHSADATITSPVYQSTDNGATWHIFSNGLPTTFPEAWHFLQNPADGQLYVNLQNGSGNTGVIYKTVGTAGGQPPQVVNAAYTAATPGLNPVANNTNIVFRYNAISGAASGLQISNPPSDNGDLSLGGSAISVHDVVLDNIDGTRWQTTDCCNYGFTFQVQNFEGGSANLHDISIWHVTGLATYSGGSSASTGGAAATGNQTIPGSSIANFRFYDNIITAGWVTGATPVCSGSTTTAQSLWQCWTPSSGLCWDNNFLAVTTVNPTGAGSFSRNNPPYPTGGDNGYCPYGTPKGNTLATGFPAYQFTNLNGAIGGNYQLLTGSPYHNKASDGTDPGATIPLVNTFTSGVR